jgi:hypothetical protein
MKTLENNAVRGFILALVCSLTLTSVVNCGKPKGSTFKDPRIMAVVEEALEDLKKQGAVDLSPAYGIDSFEFQTLTNPISIGRCIYQSSPFHAESHVFVDPAIWDNYANYQGKKVVLIHEMLHCAWSVDDHNESGIMAESSPGVFTEEEYQDLVEEAVMIINSRHTTTTTNNNRHPRQQSSERDKS